jgi:hypothetical protein
MHCRGSARHCFADHSRDTVSYCWVGHLVDAIQVGAGGFGQAEDAVPGGLSEAGAGIEVSVVHGWWFPAEERSAGHAESQVLEANPHLSDEELPPGPRDLGHPAEEGSVGGYADGDEGAGLKKQGAGNGD